jgi:hypothetical protein
MKKYHVGDRTVLLLDGDLFERLLPIDATLTSDTPLELPKRRGRKPGFKVAKFVPLAQRIGQNMERKRRKKLGPEAEDTIRTELQAGMGLTEACKKYDISVSTYYRLKNESNSKPVLEE